MKYFSEDRPGLFKAVFYCRKNVFFIPDRSSHIFGPVPSGYYMEKSFGPFGLLLFLARISKNIILSSINNIKYHFMTLLSYSF